MVRRDWERTRLDPYPAAEPVPAEPRPDRPRDNYVEDLREPAVEEEYVDPRAGRVRTVRVVNTIINIVCGLFAVVLGLNIIMVLAEANPNNGFASLVDSWSGAVSLGLRGLFTPGNEKLATLLNDGLAALGWLLIAGVLTYAIRQFALPGPGRTTQYRRRVVR
jgi:hypothetical protein